MIRKPWPIILISFVFFLIPFFNILINFLIFRTDYTFYDYIYSLLVVPTNYLALFDMVVPSLIAGFAVYSVKKWSYPVFLVCMAWLTYQMLSTFSPHIRFSLLLLTIILPMIINILYVSYILLPNVRAAYFDPRLRWWETKPRYIFSTEMSIEENGKLTAAQITNISEGGIFAIVSVPVEPNTVVNLKFVILENPIELKAKIVYRKPDGASHGLQFFEMNRNQKLLMKKTIAKLAKENYEAVRPVPVWTEDFINWFSTLVKTGKGFVPEIPNIHGMPPKNKL